MGECLAQGPERPGGEDRLSLEESRFLLQLARNTIDAYVQHLPLPVVDDASLSDRLREKRAVFVTLRNHGRLRGCIGYPAHRVGLAHAVRENVVNAASRDPRFQPVAIAEAPSITIEISVLSRGDTPGRPFTRLADPLDIVLGRDGLYVEHPDGFTGILLPQVAVEQHWNVREFLEAICEKAGLPGDAWCNPEIKLYRFSAEVFAEETPCVGTC